jgi:hypothetical protein
MSRLLKRRAQVNIPSRRCRVGLTAELTEIEVGANRVPQTKKGGKHSALRLSSVAKNQFTETDARLSLSSSTMLSGTAISRVTFSSLWVDLARYIA